MRLDLHLHLVPGVDDGAQDPAESVAMARALVAQGYRGGAVTPHIRPGLFPNEAARLRPAIEQLARDLEAAEVPFEVRPGAEHYLEPSVLAVLLAGEGIGLGDTRHVLIEAPTFGPVPALAEVTFRLEIKGLVPVFAHPERCAVFEDTDLAQRVVEAGARLQLDLGSLAGAYGRPARKLARKLLRRGLYSVAGSDLHNRPQAEEELGDWVRVLEKEAGVEGAAELLEKNPARLLAGEAVGP